MVARTQRSGGELTVFTVQLRSEASDGADPVAVLIEPGHWPATVPNALQAFCYLITRITPRGGNHYYLCFPSGEVEMRLIIFLKITQPVRGGVEFEPGP